ncbi:MAG: hypothetical protein ACI865_000257 [Flavobacteriaceae bacterium]|jgi:hypothetical protein
MKAIVTILLFSTGTIFYSCKSDNGGVNGSDSNKTIEQENKIPEIIKKNYDLSVEASTIDWTRKLDQKSMKRTMKIFGADVDIQMDAVQLEMSGDVKPTIGGFEIIDDIYDEADLFFDMKTFKFSEEKGKGLFDTKEYPTSTLTFLSFEENDLGSYAAKCELMIQDHTETVEFPVSIILKGTNLKLKGSFSFNTLLFPLRAKNQEAEINKDIISVQLDLTYILSEK